jgi:AraC-like DNA-binding protein
MNLINCLSHGDLHWQPDLPGTFKGFLIPGSEAFTSVGNFGCISVQQYQSIHYRLRLYMLQLEQTFIFKSLMPCTQLQSLVSLTGKWKLQTNPENHISLQKHQFVLPGSIPELTNISIVQRSGVLFELCFSTELLSEMNEYFPSAFARLTNPGRHSLATANINSDISGFIHSLTHCRYAPSIRSLFFNSRVRDLLFQFLLIMEGNDTIADPIAEHDKELVLKAEQIINSDLSKQLSINELAAQLLISKASFKRIFKSVNGMSPFEYMLIRRMEYARELLQSGSTTKEAAAATGYQRAGFTRAFHKLYGKLPGDI